MTVDPDMYYDTSSALQCIGCVLTDPTLLDNPKYKFNEGDFSNEFHRTMFGIINNLRQNGDTRITIQSVEDYIRDRDDATAMYKAHNGQAWLRSVFENANLSSFPSYYKRFKQMSLLKSYTKIGVDVTNIYNPDNATDPALKEKQLAKLDQMELTDISTMVETKVDMVKSMVIDNYFEDFEQAGKGSEKLIERLKTGLTKGYALPDMAMDEICYGARRGCMYLRSCPTAVGKSRLFMADCLYLGCTEIYNHFTHKWDKRRVDEKDDRPDRDGITIPSAFISVELNNDELKTMAWAYIADVEERKIKNWNLMTDDEMERVLHAKDVLEESPVYFLFLPDYSLTDIENSVRRAITQFKCPAIFLDYLTSSISMLSEVGKNVNGVKLREDQVLLMLSSKLKDLATEYNVFIYTGTQVNGTWKTETVPDQNMLSGAKSISNRVDFGCIGLDVPEDELAQLNRMSWDVDVMPNFKVSCYKNRGNASSHFLLYEYFDKGTCRTYPLFCTNYSGEYKQWEEVIGFDPTKMYKQYM